jgi:hypothetical protein
VLLAVVELLVAYLVGFLAPGYPAARLLGVRPVWCGAFSLSWLSLVLGVIFFQIAGLPLTAAGILAWQVAVLMGCGALGKHKRRLARTAVDVEPGLPATPRALLIALIALVAATMAWRLALAPLAGADTIFRWDFLARKCSNNRASHYPPVTPADYHVYFFPDAIAGGGCAVWWLYAAWGRAEPGLTTGFVLAQWVATIGFVWQLGTNLGGRTAGWLAAALLAGSAFFVRSVAIGQDAGATALGVSGALAVLTLDREVTERRAIAASALLCGVGALVREYGMAVAMLAVTPLFWPPRRWKYLACYAAVLVGLAAPWYLRNLMRLGHPFHSLPMPLFEPVSSLYAQIILASKVENAPLQQPWLVWRTTLLELLRSMPIPMVLGPIAALALVRRHAWLGVSLVLAVALWVQAIAISHGGMLYTTRVLTPAAVLAAVAVGVSVAGLARRLPVVGLACAVVVVHGLWGTLLAASFPFNLPPEKYALAPDAFVRRYQMPLAKRWLPVFAQANLPRDARILSENAYAHALLTPNSADVVPIWSPEVAFIFDGSTPPSTVRDKLRERGIRYVLLYPSSPNTRICVKHPFYTSELPLWRPIARVPGDFVLYQMPEP